MPRLPGLLICLTLLVAACNGGGHAVLPPAAFSYNGSNAFPAIVGVAISLTPTVTGTVDSYSVTPALPRGLSLSGLDGVITGTPASASTQTRYTITASNAGGSTKFPLELSVTEPPSSLTYASPVRMTAGAAITPLTPAITGDVDRYDILPALPPGLVFDSTDGIISGTPGAAKTLTHYTITAHSFAGQASFVLVLTVTPALRQSTKAVRPDSVKSS